MFQNPPIFMTEMFQNSQICFFIIFRSLLSGILYNHTFHRKDTLSLQTDCSSHFFLFDEANIVVISSEKRFILVFLIIRQPFLRFCHLDRANTKYIILKSSNLLFSHSLAPDALIDNDRCVRGKMCQSIFSLPALPDAS